MRLTRRLLPQKVLSNFIATYSTGNPDRQPPRKMGFELLEATAERDGGVGGKVGSTIIVTIFGTIFQFWCLLGTFDIFCNDIYQQVGRVGMVVLATDHTLEMVTMSIFKRLMLVFPTLELLIESEIWK